MENNIFEELKWRGLVYDHTEGLPEVLTKDKFTAYIGFDPTSDSLQVGNLLTLTGLARLQKFGHTPIAVAGGGTGMIGDPSGKSQERQLLSREQVEANVASIQKQLARFLDFSAKDNPAKIINNSDWLLSISMMDFLRDIGKYFTVNYMMAKDSVKTRLQGDEGISYTEFSYMLLQAYDFLHLYDTNKCRLQLGGSDQWGNITAGIELIRKIRGEKAYGLVWPLITNADGSKLGKTEKGTIWLSAERTSPYRFYQFWLNREDADVIQFLKYFTWFDKKRISEYGEMAAEEPEKREAQRTLAREMTRVVHDETALSKAEQASKVLFGGEISGLSADDILDIFADVPSNSMKKSEFENGKPIADILSEAGLVKSKGEARRLIDNGGLYINNNRITDTDLSVKIQDAIEGKFIVFRKGKKNYHLVQIQ